MYTHILASFIYPFSYKYFLPWIFLHYYSKHNTKKLTKKCNNSCDLYFIKILLSKYTLKFISILC